MPAFVFVQLGLFSIASLPLALALGGVHVPLLFPYRWHKLLHLFGAVLFIGHNIVSPAWMVFAARTRSAKWGSEMRLIGSRLY